MKTETLSSKIWITMHDNKVIYAKNVKDFINSLMKEVREGYYNTNLDFARLFAASINLRKILRKTT